MQFSTWRRIYSCHCSAPTFFSSPILYSSTGWATRHFHPTTRERKWFVRILWTIGLWMGEVNLISNPDSNLKSNYTSSQARDNSSPKPWWKKAFIACRSSNFHRFGRAHCITTPSAFSPDVFRRRRSSFGTRLLPWPLSPCMSSAVSRRSGSPS